MISAQQDLGDLPSPKLSWPRVLGKLEQSIAGRKRIVDRTALVSQYAGNQANDGIDQHHGRDFSTVEHEIADGDFVRPQNIDDTLIEPLITSAQQDESFVMTQLFDYLLLEPAALGCQQHHMRRHRIMTLHVFDGLHDRLDHHHHARTASKRSIIDLVMLAFRPVAQITHVHADQPRINGFLQQALAEITRKDLGKQGQNIESHDASLAAAGIAAGTAAGIAVGVIG